jgi:hypothetical protein
MARLELEGVTAAWLCSGAGPVEWTVQGEADQTRQVKDPCRDQNREDMSLTRHAESGLVAGFKERKILMAKTKAPRKRTTGARYL